MLLERFGLWDVARASASRRSRAGCASGSRSAARSCTSRSCSSSTSRSTRSTTDGAALLDRELEALPGRARSSSRPTTPSGSSRSPPAGSRSHDGYASPTSPRSRGRTSGSSCARRDTLPAMLLFVLSTLAIFHFALPAGRPARTPPTGCSGSRSSSPRCSGSRARCARARAAALLDALVLAPCDRSAIWLGKSLATLAFLVAAELVALPAFALFFAPLAGARSPRSPSRTSGSAPSARCSPRWPPPSRARELLLPLLFLPLAIPLVVGGVGASVSADGGKYLAFLGLYDARLRDTCVGLLRVCRHGITVSILALRRQLDARSRRRRSRSRSRCRLAPEDADQGISQRIFYFHVPIALTAYACFGLGRLEGAAPARGRGGEQRDLESYIAIHQGVDLRGATLITGSIWAKARGASGGAGARTSSSSSSSSSSSTAPTSCSASRSSQGPRRERICAVYALFGVAADPGQLPRDPARERLHPPDRLHARRAADDGHDVHRVLRLLGRDARSSPTHVPGRARRASGSTRSLRELREVLA